MNCSLVCSNNLRLKLVCLFSSFHAPINVARGGNVAWTINWKYVTNRDFCSCSKLLLEV